MRRRFRKRARPTPSPRPSGCARPGKSDADIGKLVDEPVQAARVAAFDAELRALAERAAGTLVEMWNIFRGLVRRGKPGGDRVPAGTEGTTGPPSPPTDS